MSDPFDWTLTATVMRLGNLVVTVPANKVEAFRARGYRAEGEEAAPAVESAKDEAAPGCC